MTIADRAFAFPAREVSPARPLLHAFVYHRPQPGVVTALFSGGASDLIEPAGTHHPAWLSSCFAGARIISVRRGAELTGLFATAAERWRWGVPLQVITSASSDLAFEGVPLVAREGAVETIGAFIAGQRGRPILLRSIPADGGFLKALAAAAAEVGAPLRIVRQWQRAALTPRGSYEKWFEANFERKRRKEYRRIGSRLGEQGRLDSLQWNDAEPVQLWIDELFDLEAKGWKGREATAIAADPENKAAVTRALHIFAREGGLRLWKLALNDEPIAMMFALVSAGKAWLGKIAYDETFAKYSPGVLLILAATRSLFEDEAIAFADSCAIPDHPMIDNIWRERIAMCDVLIGRPGMPQGSFSAMIAAERTRGRFRTAAKRIYCHIAGKRRS